MYPAISDSVFAFHARIELAVLGVLSDNVTGIVFGARLPPDGVTVIVALYVPLASPAVFTLAVMVSTSVVVVPDAMLVLSQAASSEIVHVNVPPVVLEMARVFEAGLVPPAVAVNPSVEGVRLRDGVPVLAVVPDATVRATAIF